jgi:predicted GNAT superfamily acetyltransferase
MQWSHMLGVLDPYRNSGLGRELKLAQRRRTIELGLDLVEWTYDPLQALNAHLNFRRLGVVVEEYAVNVYGESTSPLHGSTPTDRFIAAWYVREPHVERRIQPGPAGEARSDAALEPINRLTRQGDWLACADDFAVPAGAERFAVEIPVGYTEMLRDAPALADDWRLKIRRIFTESFERGYRVVDFLLDRPAGRGRYVVAPVPSESPRSTGRSG